MPTTLYDGLLESCDGGGPLGESQRSAYFSFFELFVVNLVVLLVLTTAGSLRAVWIGEQAVAAGEDAAARHEKQTRRNTGVLCGHAATLFVGTAVYVEDAAALLLLLLCWCCLLLLLLLLLRSTATTPVRYYHCPSTTTTTTTNTTFLRYLSGGLPKGDDTCGFLFVVSLPLYKPIAGPLWRLLTLLLRAFFQVEGASLHPRATPLLVALVAWLCGTVLSMAAYALPLVLVFAPAFLVLVGVVVLTGCAAVALVGACAVAGSIRSYAFSKSVLASFAQLSLLFVVGMCVFFTVAFGSWYTHPGRWVKLFLGSWQYGEWARRVAQSFFGSPPPLRVNPAHYGAQINDLLAWPSAIGSAAEAVLAAGLALLGSEYAIDLAPCVLAAVAGTAAANARRAAAAGGEVLA